MPRPIRLALLNPNTNTATTEFMAGIARRLAPDHVRLEPHTMLLGPSVITDEATLASAAAQIVTAGRALAADGVDAILIAGFGDPGLGALRDRLGLPVTGIAEAGMAAAARGGRRFSIVTTTPDLAASIRGLVAAFGHADSLVSLRITADDVKAVMADPERMAQALSAIARDCAADGAEAVLIGGGPLAVAARRIACAIPLPVVEPVAAGVALALERLGVATAAAC